MVAPFSLLSAKATRTSYCSRACSRAGESRQTLISLLAVPHADDHLPYRAIALHDPMGLRNMRHVEYAMDGHTRAPARDLVQFVEKNEQATGSNTQDRARWS